MKKHVKTIAFAVLLVIFIAYMVFMNCMVSPSFIFDENINQQGVRWSYIGMEKGDYHEIGQRSPSVNIYGSPPTIDFNKVVTIANDELKKVTSANDFSNWFLTEVSLYCIDATNDKWLYNVRYFNKIDYFRSLFSSDSIRLKIDIPITLNGTITETVDKGINVIKSYYYPVFRKSPDCYIVNQFLRGNINLPPYIVTPSDFTLKRKWDTHSNIPFDIFDTARRLLSDKHEYLLIDIKLVRYFAKDDWIVLYGISNTKNKDIQVIPFFMDSTKPKFFDGTPAVSIN